jgi:FAD/FMN-containing dehydrogenase
VLANGEVITTDRLSRKDLNKKLGLSTFEGEIYRSLDALLEENKEAVALTERNLTKNASGYDVRDVRHKDGSFDLTPLFVGSQGTLGIITEIELETEAHNPETALLLAAFDDAQKLQHAVLELKQDREMPSAIEVVDGQLLARVSSLHPAHLKGIVNAPYPKFILLTEYDEVGRNQKRSVKRGAKILETYALQVQVVTNLEDQESLWKIRYASALATEHAEANAKALPFIEDGAVPVDRLADFLTGIYDIFTHNRLPVAMWGHAGDGNLHLRPHLDLSQIGDRQRLFRLMEEYYHLVVSLGGTITAEHGDGRVRAPYLEKMYGSDVYELFKNVKQIFDPYGTLNPGVKIGSSIEDLKATLRQSYSFDHLYQHLPRS